MNNSYQGFLICFVFYLLLAGCRQEGCMDCNAVNYNSKASKNDGFCTYRYLNLVVINKIPEKTIEDTIVGYNNPNLKFYLKMSDEIYWNIETPIAENITIFPYSWEIVINTDNQLLWNKNYEYLLTNEHFKGRDTIFYGTFIPSQIYKDDKIILKNKNETAEIELNFVVY